MGLFGTAKLSYLGVDIGSSGIKIVELQNQNGRPVLVTYGYSEKPIMEIKTTPAVENVDQTAAAIKNICKKSKVTSSSTIASLPSFSVFTSIITLPSMPKKELDNAIKYEAKKLIPMPIENMVLDYKIIETAKKEAGAAKTEEANQAVIKAKGLEATKILLTAAPKELVEKYVEVFKKAGLNLLSLETEAFALTRSLIGSDKSTIMLVDLGAVTTNISIIDKGIPILNRSIDTGGMFITEAIQRNMNVDKEQAEQIKKDLSLTATLGPEEILPRQIEQAITPLINEIKYVFNIYQGSNQPTEGGRKAIEKIILAGGSAFLPNLTNYISKLLDIKVFIGDPWARVVYPEDLKPALDEIGPKFAAAIGLAMRNIE